MVSVFALVASVFNLDTQGHYLRWGLIEISMTNLVVIILMVLVFIAAGIGVLNTLNNHGVMNAVPATSAAVGSGTINTVRGFSTALGLAVGGAVFMASGGSSSVAHDV